MTTRRSFLASLRNIALSLAAAPLLCRAAKEMAPVLEKVTTDGMVWIKDPFPLRFFFEDGKYVNVVPYLGCETISGPGVKMNPEYVDAPYEQRVFVNPDPKNYDVLWEIHERKPLRLTYGPECSS